MTPVTVFIIIIVLKTLSSVHSARWVLAKCWWWCWGGDAVIGRACRDLGVQLLCPCGTDLPSSKQYGSCEVSVTGRKLGLSEVEPLPSLTPRAGVASGRRLRPARRLPVRSLQWQQQTDPFLKTVFLVLNLFPYGLDSVWKCTENLTHENYLPTERDCNKWIRLPELAAARQELDQSSSHGSWGVQPSKPWGWVVTFLRWAQWAGVSKAGILRAHGCCSPPHLGGERVSGTRVCLHTRCASWAGSGGWGWGSLTFAKEMLLCVCLLTLLWWFLWVISKLVFLTSFTCPLSLKCCFC